MGAETGDAETRRIAIVVVNYGSSALLAANLAHIIASDRYDVVVVDNRTTDEERARIRELGAQRSWAVVEPATNTGFGGGVNLGVATARDRGAHDILLLNPDARIETDDIETLAQAAAADRNALYAPLIRRPDGRVWFEGLWLDESDGAIRRAHDQPAEGHLWLTGACLFIPLQAWDRFDGFDEDYFLYWEDVDLSRRALDASCTLHVVREATAVHDVGGTQDKRGQAKSPTYYFFTIRNRMLYATKHLDANGIRRWRADDVRQAWAIVMRGGRRQFLRPITPLRAMIRGVRAGRALARAALERRVVRVYLTARTAHLERDAGREDVTLLYAERRSDFDADIARHADARQLSAFGVFRDLLRRKVTVVEINEPLFLRAVPRSIAVIAAVGLRALAGRGRTAVVAYCIENLDPTARADLGLVARAKRAARMFLARRVWRRLDRIVYGTPGARDLYGAVLGRPGPRAEVTLVPALPSAAVSTVERAEPPQVVFLGAFVERKGYRETLAAWAHVRAALPDARLVMMGKGAGVEEVQAAAAADASIEVILDPPRERLFEVLSASTVLVLPSLRRPNWREQVGLPIVEGLSAGCEVVTTTETGLAEWLRSHGHRTVDPTAPPEVLGGAIAAVLGAPRRRAEIQADLPREDGRLAADAWLTREPGYPSRRRRRMSYITYT